MIDDELVCFKQFMRQYVCMVRWQNAKSYENTYPHEYTVKQWCPLREAWFESIVVGIRKYGVKKKFGKRTYIYLKIDNKAYWTLGYSVSHTTLINRVALTDKQTLLY